MPWWAWYTTGIGTGACLVVIIGAGFILYDYIKDGAPVG